MKPAPMTSRIGDACTVITSAIGWIFIVASFIGAAIPGMNFHIIYGKDSFALKSHLQAAERLKDKVKDVK